MLSMRHNAFNFSNIVRHFHEAAALMRVCSFAQFIRSSRKALGDMNLCFWFGYVKKCGLQARNEQGSEVHVLADYLSYDYKSNVHLAGI